MGRRAYFMTMRALLVVVALLAIPTDDAEACSCVPRTYAQHAKSAKQVLLARAGKPTKTGDHTKQTFTVLATFKGPATTQFLLDRPATSPCASEYAEGDVAILFANGRDLDLCAGNMPLATQLDELRQILDATRTKRSAAKADAVEAALREALARYTHDRPKIWVRHAALAGTSFQLGTSKLEYTRKATKGEVRILNAFTTGSIAFVEGNYALEGLRFTVLLHLDTTWRVLRASVAER